MICRSCGAGLEANRIDTSMGIITCSHCGSLHNIPVGNPEMPANSAPSTPAAKPERSELSLPSRFKVRKASGSMEVSWPVGGLFPGLVLSIIATAFAYVALTSGMWFILIASAGLFYYAAVRAFNTHRIRVDGAYLEVSQRPLPVRGNHKLNASDITQLFTTEYESRTETGDDNNRRVSIRKLYRLSAKTQSAGRVTVLSGLSDPQQALWLEQEIERLLSIVDKRVAGEHEPLPKAD